MEKKLQKSPRTLLAIQVLDETWKVLELTGLTLVTSSKCCDKCNYSDTCVVIYQLTTEQIKPCLNFWKEILKLNNGQSLQNII